jgi:2-polyprenyl-6-methoxyphenol hydroxylase-like FAD-dependent oxidoreductase
VGDAGYFKDPIAAHGITDAMRDAELLARAVIDVITNDVDEAAALGGYETTRNRLSEQLLTIADVIASFTWDTTQVAALLLQLAASMTEEVETLASLDVDAPALAG